MMDTQDRTYVWEYSQEDYPDSIVQLYLGSIKVLFNSSTWEASPYWRAAKKIK
jgi:hypothetical protein